MRTPRARECQEIERSKGERLQDISDANVFSVGSHSRRMKIYGSDRGMNMFRGARLLSIIVASQRELNAKRISRRELL